MGSDRPPITYSLQFRGQATPFPGGLRKHGRAPGCAIVTSLAPHGLEARFVWSDDEVEAMLESTLVYTGAAGCFSETGTLHLAPGHALRISGTGRLDASPDPGLRQGTASWEVVAGTGALAGAAGRITSNVLLSATGDLTESHLGVLFTTPPSSSG
jgi:hypothetical protein